MLTVTNLCKSYGAQQLFDRISFTAGSGEKIGIVGRNGHGKTTLFRIITGKESPDSGQVVIPKGYTTGYLEQDFTFTQASVLDECLHNPAGPQPEEWEARRILTGLGFMPDDFDRHPAELSGGFGVRLNLARTLLSNPNLLLLDEPTNFLDIISIRWLERFLQSLKSEMMIISHDRSFMDSVVTHVMGIHRGQLRKYKGNTLNYYSSVEKEEETWEKQRVNEAKKRKQAEVFITRFRAKARQANLVQSRIKSLEKMEQRAQLEKIPVLSFNFSESDFPSQYLMEARNISFRYSPETPVLIDNFSLTVEKGDRICIIGKNGAGKTTLLKLLARNIEPCSGEITTHHQVRPSWYEQANTALLHDNLTIEEELASVSPSGERKKVFDVCGAMMFPGDSSKKKISVLSGGERCRVLIGKLLLAPANLLLLDEPTHHLDLQACEAMAEALAEFNGTAIVVSHDEGLLHRVANKLIIFQENRIRYFPGTYAEFLDRIGWGDEETAGSGPTVHTASRSSDSRSSGEDSDRSFAGMTNQDPANSGTSGTASGVAHGDASDSSASAAHGGASDNPAAGNRNSPGGASKTRRQIKELKKIKADFIKRRSRLINPLKQKIGELETAIEKNENLLAIFDADIIEASQNGNGKKIADLSRQASAARQENELLWENMMALTGRLEELSNSLDEEARATGIEC